MKPIYETIIYIGIGVIVSTALVTLCQISNDAQKENNEPTPVKKTEQKKSVSTSLGVTYDRVLTVNKEGTRLEEFSSSLRIDSCGQANDSIQNSNYQLKFYKDNCVFQLNVTLFGIDKTERSYKLGTHPGYGFNQPIYRVYYYSGQLEVSAEGESEVFPVFVMTGISLGEYVRGNLPALEDQDTTMNQIIIEWVYNKNRNNLSLFPQQKL